MIKIGALGGGKKIKKVVAPSAPQMVLNLPQGHEDSEYVLSFKIGQRKSDFYSGRTDRQSYPVRYFSIYILETAALDIFFQKYLTLSDLQIYLTI